MHHIAIWIISFLSVAGVIIRPCKLPEAVWAVTGAIVLIIFRLILPADGLTGVAKGLDVYLFLTGMMLLAETAREEKLFDWLAAHAAKLANGSSGRLFLLIYVVGTIVTVFLSNDATAVVLTPAVAAICRAAKVEKPMPYLLICAFIANAASFVLPISNPANLVIYGSHIPSLFKWLSKFALPSLFSITVTYIVLRFTQRTELKQSIATAIPVPELSPGGKMALFGIITTAVILLVASGFAISLGLPTAVAGALTSLLVIIGARKDPSTVIKGVSWSVLPLVAGLFVIVEALNKTGLTLAITRFLYHSVQQSIIATAWGSGFITAIACNLMNNLPAGLIAANITQTAHIPDIIKSAVLIGVDLGPNLSLTGSLATILWLVALRREGHNINAWDFLKFGSVVMTTALIAALGSLWL